MQEILDYILNTDEGVTISQIQQKFPKKSQQAITSILNTLLKTSKIDIIKTATSIIYKKNQNLLKEEKIIYELIKENKSIWIRDLKQKSNIPINILPKILQNMEQKLLIKSIKSIKNNRKMYVLFTDQVSNEITGGIWFTNGNVDTDLVNVIGKIIFNYLKQGLDKYQSAKDLYEYVEKCKVIKSQFSVSDIEDLLKVLVYDEKIIELNSEQGVLYRISNEYSEF